MSLSYDIVGLSIVRVEESTRTTLSNGLHDLHHEFCRVADILADSQHRHRKAVTERDAAREECEKLKEKLESAGKQIKQSQVTFKGASVSLVPMLNDGIAIMVGHSYVASIRSNGKLTLIGGVDPDVGLALDDYQQIVVARNGMPEHQAQVAEEPLPLELGPIYRTEAAPSPAPWLPAPGDTIHYLNRGEVESAKVTDIRVQIGAGHLPLSKCYPTAVAALRVEGSRLIKKAEEMEKNDASK